ncbi:MAG: bifunctional heptose 7-phosphate kinase/heptose 1-phosphate adenyltransferase [Pseudonocardia sp.]
MTAAPLVVIGDTLCDLDIWGTVSRSCPDAASAPVLDAGRAERRPGGAGLAALLAASVGVPVRLITALADDEEGVWLAEALGRRTELVAGALHGTTTVKARMLDRGRPLLRVDHGHGTPIVDAGMVEALHGAGAILVSDYGRGVCGDPRLVRALCAVAGEAPIVWDPHPRGGPPVAGCAVVTPNLAEARRAAQPRVLPEAAVPAAVSGARALLGHWSARAVAVTVGSLGAVLAQAPADRTAPGGTEPLLVPARPAPVGADPCGAGDCFAATLTAALHRGASPGDAVQTAVRCAGEFVRAGGATSVRLGAVSPVGPAGIPLTVVPRPRLSRISTA